MLYETESNLHSDLYVLVAYILNWQSGTVWESSSLKIFGLKKTLLSSTSLMPSTISRYP